MGELERNDPRIRDVGERRGPRGDESVSRGASKAHRWPKAPKAPKVPKVPKAPKPTAAGLPTSPPTHPRTPPRTPSPLPASPTPQTTPPVPARRKPARKKGGSGSAWKTVFLVFALIGLPVKCMQMLRDREEQSSTPKVEFPVPLNRPPGGDLRDVQRRWPAPYHPGTRPPDRTGLVGRVRMVGEVPVPSGVGLDLRLIGGGSIRQHTKRDGTFSFTGLPPGTHTLELAVVAALGSAKPPSVPIERGAEAILLSVDGARALRLSCVYPEMLRNDMEVIVASHDGSERAKGAWSHLDTGGLVIGTEPGHVYDVLIRHEGANLAALVENLGAADGAFVPLLKAAAIAGRVRLPADVTSEDVEGELSLRGIRIPVHFSSDGTFRIPALPGGSTWTLRLEAPTGEILPEVVVQDVLVGPTRSIEVSFE